MRLLLLGGFGIDAGTDAVGDAPAGTWKLLALLALRRSAPRAAVAGTLWPEATEERANSCLRSALWRLRKTLPDLVESQNGTLALRADVSSDIDDLLGAATAILESDSGVPRDFSPLLRDGDLLPAWDDDWVTLERERVRLLRLEALDVLAGRLIAAGRPGSALQAALAALGTDPLRESSSRRAIQAHLVQGNVAQAQARYDAYAALLDDELGLAPSPSIQELFPARHAGRAAGRDHAARPAAGRAHPGTASPGGGRRQAIVGLR